MTDTAPCERCSRSRRHSALARLAPGTVLRDGVERIQRRNGGALIVLGHDPALEELCSGGFELDAELTATALAELAKMDGAIVLHDERIIRAAVHLVPDRRIPARESGTRHRTAERVARQTGHAVVSVSQSAQSITVYIDDHLIVLEDPLTLRARANQALATVERCARRLDELTVALTALDTAATVGDIAAVAQRLEMSRRASLEVEEYAAALGHEGPLLLMQRDEIVSDLDTELRVLVRGRSPLPLRRALSRLSGLSAPELAELTAVAHALGLGPVPEQAAAPDSEADHAEHGRDPW